MDIEGAYYFQSPLKSNDKNLKFRVRDPLLHEEENEAVRFLWDLGFGFCYPGGPIDQRQQPLEPNNGQYVYDMAERNNGKVVIAGGQSIGFSGGGFDFSKVTSQNNFLEIPAAVAADIYSPFGGVSQRFCVVAYIRLPAKADWNGAAAIAPMLSFASGNASSANHDLITIGQNSTQYRLSAIRQTSGSTLTEMNIAMNDADFGKLAQITFWRSDSSTGLSIRTARARTVITGVVGPDNTGNFGSQVGKAGVGNAYWSPAVSESKNAVKFKHYRGYIWNLARCKIDPIEMIEADWMRVQTRILKSAENNGGISQIFN